METRHQRSAARIICAEIRSSRSLARMLASRRNQTPDPDRGGKAHPDRLHQPRGRVATRLGSARTEQLIRFRPRAW